MSDEQMAREWLSQNSWLVWNEAIRHVPSLTALLASRALEEAKWWAKNGTHGHVTDEAVERIAALEQAAAGGGQ